MKKNIIIAVFIFVFLCGFISYAQATLDYTTFLDKVINVPYKFHKTQDSAYIYIEPDAVLQDEDLKYMMLEVSSTILLLDSRQTVKYVTIDCASQKENYLKKATLDTLDLLSRFKGDISLAELLSRISVKITDFKEPAQKISPSGGPDYKELPIDAQNLENIKERQERQRKALSLLEDGRSLNASGQYKGAVDYLKEALGINLNLHECYYELAFAHNGLGDYDNAVSYAKQYINFKPSEKKGYMILGQVYAVQKNWQRAFTAYKSAAEFSDEASKYVNNKIGKVTSKEIAALESYTQQHPDDISAAVKLALCYEAKGRFKDGVAIWQRLLESE